MSEVIGLRLKILRSSWVNFDYIWSFVLIVGGLFIFFLNYINLNDEINFGDKDEKSKQKKFQENKS